MSDVSVWKTGNCTQNKNILVLNKRDFKNKAVKYFNVEEFEIL